MGEVTFTFRVGEGLKEAFAEAARARDRTAAQLLRDYMREVVQHQREDEDYEAWLRRKVEAARASIGAGRGVSAETAAAEFAALRAETRGRFDSLAE